MSALAVSSCSQQKTVQRPNVLFILADDLGYGDTGCYGADKIKTPNIDKFATEGRRFTDAHSASAVSTPSRYALLTGEYPFRGQDPTMKSRGLYGPLGRQTPLIIDVDDLSLPEMMQRQGYTTACIGKWHLGFSDEDINWNEPLKPGPNEVGFDYYFGVPLVNSHAPYFYVENHTVVGHDPNDPIHFLGGSEGATATQLHEAKSANVYSGGELAHSLYKDDEGAETLLGKAIDWLDSAKESDQPFFMYFSSTHIHHPFTPSDRFKGSSECGIYGDYAQELDWMIGELMTYLDDNGLRENTIVVVTSDNGGMLNYGGQEAWEEGHSINGDLLGYKFGVWEGGHRIPFIVRWPGEVEPGTVSDCMICNVDMMATMAALTGYELQEGDCVDSYNVLEAFTGNPKKMIRPELLLTCRQPSHQALRLSEWVYIPKQGEGGFGGSKPGMHGFGGAPAVTFEGRENSDIENGKFKEDAPKRQLYNVVDDMKQTQNVVESNPEIEEQLKARLAEIKTSSSTR